MPYTCMHVPVSKMCVDLFSFPGLRSANSLLSPRLFNSLHLLGTRERKRLKLFSFKVYPSDLNFVSLTNFP